MEEKKYRGVVFLDGVAQLPKVANFAGVLPVVITEKDIKAKLKYSGYALYLYAKCPHCGESFILDEDNVAHKCPSAYKYFHKKAYRGDKK